MRTFGSFLILTLLSLPLGVRADEAKAKEPAKKAAPSAPAAKADPTGTWTWTNKTPNGEFESTATFKLAGDKVTGNVTGRRGDTPISDGQFKNGTLTFTLVRERNGNKMTSKFEGKIEGDAIKGTMKMDRGEGEQSRAWEAKRK
jgi:hypothetical protein